MGALPGTSGRRRIYLMRHGHVDYSSREVVEARDPRIARLTPLGLEQAAAAAAALADVPFDIAVCSGLPRTRETASIVLAANPPGPGLQDLPDLEEVHSGTFIPFATKEELDARLAFVWERTGEAGARFFDDGELFADARERAVRGLGTLLDTPGWANALVVAHEGINRLLLAWMAGAGPGGALAFEQDLACVNVLDFDLTPAPDGSRVLERRMIKAANVTPYAWLKAGLHMTSFEAIFTRPSA